MKPACAIPQNGDVTDAAAPDRRTPALTKRELDIVKLVSQGMKNKEIGRELQIAERTVKNHLQSIFSKLQVSNRLELAVFAIRNGIGQS